MADPLRPLWAAEVFCQPLRQPDQRSCGAAVLVVAELLARPELAELAGTPMGFRRQALAMHRRVTSPVDARGRLQLPWPRVFGTPPWAVARQLEASTGTDHDVRLTWPGRAAAYDRIAAATAQGHPVPLYVGSAWLPRHLVLAVGEVESALRVYEPASGRLVDVTRERFTAEKLDLAGWDRPWLMVVPRVRRTPA